MSSESVKILTGRLAENLTLLREASADADAGAPLELTLGAEAIEGLEKTFAGIAAADLELITLSSAQLVRGMRRAISGYNHPSNER